MNAKIPMIAKMNELRHLHYIYNHDHYLIMFTILNRKQYLMPYLNLNLYIAATRKRSSVYFSWRFCPVLCTYFKHGHIPAVTAALDLSRSCSPWPLYEEKGSCPPVHAHLETLPTAMKALGHLLRNKCVPTTVRVNECYVTNNLTNRHLAPIDGSNQAYICYASDAAANQTTILTFPLQIGPHTGTKSDRRRV